MDQGEKTEEPTGKRQGDFRKEGKVPTSRDLTGVAVTLCALLVFVSQGPHLARTIEELFGETAHVVERAPDADPHALVVTALTLTGKAALAMGGLVILASLVVGVVAGVAQTGGLWTTKPLGFRWERLALLSGLKRAFASVDTLTQLGLSMLKAAVLGVTLYLVLRGYVASFASLSRVTLLEGLRFVGHVMLVLMIAALLASAVIGIIDYLLTRRRIHEQMKMTKQEVKDEHKQQEGDDQVKSRMRAKMRQIGRNQMLAATRTADVVVVNPTHYACALTYRFGQSGAPKLVAKGKDHMAARIREIARKHQIPIVANPPVARAIYAATRVGQEVPPELFEMVAKVIAYLYRIAANRGQVPSPTRAA